MQLQILSRRNVTSALKRRLKGFAESLCFHGVVAERPQFGLNEPDRTLLIP
jgi:hypothetical protein